MLPTSYYYHMLRETEKKQRSKRRSIHLYSKYDRPAKGVLQIKELTSNQIILKKDNLVVNSARRLIRDYLLTSDPNFGIKYMKFGSKGTEDVALLTPKAPSVDDTSLFEDIEDNIYTKEVTAEAVGDYSVDFVAILGLDEANISVQGGVFPITEAGLFNAQGQMFSHITFANVTKDASKAFEFRWTITF